MNTYEKQGEGGPVMVNQISDMEICPACPGLAGEKHRDDRPVPTSSGRFRPCRKGPLFTRSLSFPYFLTSLPRYFLPRSAFNSVHGDAAHELGEKIGGLLRHHFPARGDFHHLVDVAGIQQERNLRAPSVNGGERGERFPLVRQVGFRRNRLRRDAQSRLQDFFVELHHYQLCV